MAEPISSLVVNGGAGALLLGLGVALLARSAGRAAKLLGAYLAVTGSLFVWVHVARWTDDPRDASAAFAASRAPFYFAWLLLALFASAETGLHARFWSRRAVVALAAALPTTFLLVDLVTPPGEPFAWFSLSIFLLTCSFVYAVALFAVALRRERVPSAIPLRALLLAAFAIVGTASLVELLAAPARWRFAVLLFGGAPPLVPESLALLVPLSVALPLVPLVAFVRAPASVRGLAIAALAIAAFVAPTTVLAAAPSTQEGDTSNVRWLVFTLLVTYAALRHGYLGSRRVATPLVEYPLAAAGLGSLFATFLLALQLHVSAGMAIALAFGLALLVGTLVAGLSAAPVGRPRAMDRYAPHRELAPGAVLALDRRLHRDVVLERLPNEAALDRARAAARVKHPSLVAVHDVVEDADGALAVIEHVGAGTLEERLRAGPLSPEEASRVRRDVASALAAVHAAGLSHGDVRASNVHLREDGRAVLAGLVRARGGGAPEDARALEALVAGSGG